MGDSLTLTIPKGCAISASDQVKVVFDLKDRAGKAVNVIAKDTCFWDYKDKYDYEKIQTADFGGACGYATLHYITYRYAVIAIVEVIFFRGQNDDTGADNAYVFGDIVAQCGRNYSYLSTLFKKTEQQSVSVSYGSPINLSRRVVAVPAYSSLLIDVDLWNRDTGNIIQKKMEFEATEYSFFHPFKSDAEGPNGRIQVQVHWSHAYIQPPPDRKIKHKIEEDFNEGNMNGKSLQEKRPRLSDQQPLSALSVSRNLLPDAGKSSTSSSGIIVMELFSVLIGSHNDEEFDMYGSIKVEHEHNQSFIFNKDKRSAETLLPNQLAPIISPEKPFAGPPLSLKVNLKDVDGHVISLGYFWWEKTLLETPILWYDRQLCSVITGDHGYAAIHYTIFSDGLQATIRICLVGEKPSTNGPLVHGSIFAEYGDYKYITYQEKEHFRSKLFQRQTENPELLLPEFELPLSKHVVVVPRNSTLIVDIDLTIESETFKDRPSFKTDVGQKCKQKIIGSDQNSVVVCVEWSEVFVPPVRD